MKALEKFHTYQPTKGFQSWIYAIAHNHLVDHFRKNKTTVDIELLENVLVDKSDTKAGLQKREAAEQVEVLLHHLSAQEKEIVLLRYQQELPMKDIAEIVDKEETTVRVIVHRSLAKLRRRQGEVLT